MIATNMPSVVLRALEPEDLELLYSIENNEELWAVSNSCTPISRYVLKQYLASQPQDVFQTGELRLVIEDLDRGLSVGLLDLTGLSVLDGRAEVGIAILQSERGKGIGQASLSALCRYAKKNLHLRMLFAQVSVSNNAASEALFESAGYKGVAVLPKWHYENGEFMDITIFLKIL